MSGEQHAKPLKAGRLHVCLKGILSKAWYPRWIVLLPQTPSYSSRLEMYDLPQDGLSTIKPPQTKRSLIISNARLATRLKNKARQYTFRLTIRKEKHIFSADSERDFSDWLTKLRDCVLSVDDEIEHDEASNISQSEMDCDDLPTANNVVFDNNVLYQSADILRCPFNVTIVPNEDAKRLGLSGDYVLLLNTASLSLVEKESGKHVCLWPYKYIRRYGRTPTCFSIEVGRKCMTGEGCFSFISDDGLNIFQQAQKMLQKLTEKEMAAKDRLIHDTAFVTGKGSQTMNKERSISTGGLPVPVKQPVFRTCSGQESSGPCTKKLREELENLMAKDKISKDKRLSPGGSHGLVTPTITTESELGLSGRTKGAGAAGHQELQPQLNKEVAEKLAHLRLIDSIEEKISVSTTTHRATPSPQHTADPLYSLPLKKKGKTGSVSSNDGKSESQAKQLKGDHPGPPGHTYDDPDDVFLLPSGPPVPPKLFNLSSNSSGIYEDPDVTSDQIHSFSPSHALYSEVTSPPKDPWKVCGFEEKHFEIYHPQDIVRPEGSYSEINITTASGKSSSPKTGPVAQARRFKIAESDNRSDQMADYESYKHDGNQKTSNEQQTSIFVPKINVSESYDCSSEHLYDTMDSLYSTTSASHTPNTKSSSSIEPQHTGEIYDRIDFKTHGIQTRLLDSTPEHHALNSIGLSYSEIQMVTTPSPDSTQDKSILSSNAYEEAFVSHV